MHGAAAEIFAGHVAETAAGSHMHGAAAEIFAGHVAETPLGSKLLGVLAEIFSGHVAETPAGLTYAPSNAQRFVQEIISAHGGLQGGAAAEHAVARLQFNLAGGIAASPRLQGSLVEIIVTHMGGTPFETSATFSGAAVERFVGHVAEIVTASELAAGKEYYFAIAHVALDTIIFSATSAAEIFISSGGIVALCHRRPVPRGQQLGLLRLGLVALRGYSSPLNATAGLVFAGNGNGEDSPAAFQGTGGMRFVCAGGLRGGFSLSALGRLRLLSTCGLVAGVSAHALDADAILVMSGAASEVPSGAILAGVLLRTINATSTGGIAVDMIITGVLDVVGARADEDTWLLLRRKEDN